jgi:hypothetical protein
MLRDPIFIIGTERSGSNLLRLLLNAHSRISIPHPPHFLRDFAPLEKLYGDLSSDAGFERLARDAARFVNLHFAPWPFTVSERKLLVRAESRSLYGIYAALYELYREHSGKARWGCKSTFMYRYAGEILHHHPEPRFLHLVRDPRDVAASAEASIFSRYHPFKQAGLWAAEQGAIESKRGELGERRYLRVRYEDLTARPEAEVRRIMQFLGEEFEPGQLQYFRGSEASDLSALSESWKNCAKPVSTGSVGRYRERLTSREIGWVEHQARDLMLRYGYEPETGAARPGPSLSDLIEIEALERLRRLKAEGRSLLKDRNFSLRWKKWLYLQYTRRMLQRGAYS